MSKTTKKTARFDIAVGLAIETLQSALDGQHRLMLRAVEQKSDTALYEALNLSELAIDESLRMEKRDYKNYDDSAGDFVRLGSLISAINRLCGERPDAIGSYSRSAATYTDVFLLMLEIAGDETGERHE